MPNKTRPTSNTPDRIRALQAITHELLGWSARRLAQELKCSPSMLLQMASGERQQSADTLLRIRNVERTVAFLLKEAETLTRLQLDWLVAAVERHASEFTAQDLKHIAKSLRGKQ